MSKEGRDVMGFFGDVIHYDENGKKIGVSRRGLFGYVDYDANGKRMGRSIPNIFGGLNHYDTKGKKTGESTPRFFGGSNHYDAEGNRVGQSTPSFIAGWDYKRERQRAAETAGATAGITAFAIHKHKENQFADRYYAALNQYEREMQSLADYRDPDHYIKRVDVSTNFHLGDSTKNWSYQDCNINITPVLDESFEKLSDLKKCQIIYDITWDIRGKFEDIRDNSEFIAIQSEGGTRNPYSSYINVRNMNLGYSDWVWIYCQCDNRYQYYDGKFIVNSVHYDVDKDWKTGKILKVTSPYAKREESQSSGSSSSGSTSSSSSGSSASGSGHTSTIDDQDVEAYYYDYPGDFEDEDDAWDDLEDNEDEWDD